METQMNNVILVPTDFTEVADNAIHQAVQAAKYFKYKVVLLHVIDKNTKTALKKDNLSDTSVVDKLQAIANEIKGKDQVEVEVVSREGSIFTTIAEVAKEVGARLLYMGTHGKVGLDQMFLGSYALKVVTSSPAPVIVVQKRSFEAGYSKIVLPITSNAGPWEKTKWATYIASRFQAEIIIYQLPGEEIAEAVSTITEHFVKAGVKYTVRTADKSADFSKQVIDYATAVNADLIMIMTNPEKGLPTFILGSYDEDMIFNTSQIPVMCINPRELNWTKIVDY
ncbi:MAG: universal stress protein [Sphingobacteriia bacterium]|nr:universal stress protein [Sphingobacteriia bacterium]